MKINYNILIVQLPLAVVFFILGWFLSATTAADTSTEPHILHSGQQGLINPLLDYEYGYNPANLELQQLREKVSTRIEVAQNDGQVDFVSVYYRDLNNGPWFGINEKQEYMPASLLKVPLLIAYLKLAETNPALLHSTTTYFGEFSEQANIANTNETLEIGKTYTVLELLEKMILYSDNVSKDMLTQLNYTPGDFAVLNEVARTLDLVTGNISEYTTAKQYAGVFRILYNASYLSKEHSQLALDMLTKTTYDHGITSGIPEGVLVANKFGLGGETQKHQEQLHDCGIIYHPTSPYILCIMTSGSSIVEQQLLLGDISNLVYNHVSKTQP